MLQIDLVALEHTVRVLGAPPKVRPVKTVVNHRYHGMRDVTLLLCQARIQILAEFGGQLFDDDRRVVNLLAIQLNEGILATLGSAFHLVVNILWEREAI